MSTTSKPKEARREGRSFGLGVGGVLALVGAWWLWRGRFPAAAPWVLAAGVLLLIGGLAAPGLLAAPARAWLRFGEALSYVTTRIVLGVVFYLVLTPLGLLRRLVGSDPLGRTSNASRGSFWRPYPARQRDPHHYLKMY
jgi:hypothetical protein